MNAANMTSRERRVAEIAGLLTRFKGDGQPDLLRIERSEDGDDTALALSLRGAVVSADDLRRIALPIDHPERAYDTVSWYRALIDGEQSPDVLLLDVPDDRSEMRDGLEQAVGYDGGIMIIHVVDRAPADHCPAVRRA